MKHVISSVQVSETLFKVTLFDDVANTVSIIEAPLQ